MKYDILTENFIFLLGGLDFIFGFLTFAPQLGFTANILNADALDAYNIMLEYASFLLLVSSGVTLFWERTRLRIACDPMITMQEFETCYGISSTGDEEGQFTVFIKRNTRFPSKFIKSLEIEIPAEFEVEVADARFSLIKLKPTVIDEDVGGKRLIYDSCQRFNRNVSEMKFRIYVNKGKPLSKNEFDCKVTVRYKYWKLPSNASEEFHINTPW